MMLTLASLLVPLEVSGGDLREPLSNEELFQLLNPSDSQSLYHTGVPKNPRLYQDSLLHSDKELTVVSGLLTADTSFKIDELLVNDQLVPVFKLSSGQYIEASKLKVFDDQILSEESLPETIFVLKKNHTLLDAPYTLGTKTLKSSLKAYQKVTVTKFARTFSGTYYYIKDKGWIFEQELYASDESFQAVQDLLDDKYAKDKYHIYVKQLDSQEVAQVNAEKLMYGASIAKLATVYVTQQQLDDGQLQLTDKLKYTKAVNQFSGSYDTDGAGSMSKTPDNKEYSVKDLLMAIGKESDNAASNILTYYVTDKNSKDFQKSINDLVGGNWDMKERQLSAALAANMMELLYVQDGEVLEFLKDTSFADSRIPKAVDVKVAHKTGDADDYRHDVAIVYADRPFILSIFTDGATHEDITAIAKDVYSILKWR